MADMTLVYLVSIVIIIVGIALLILSRRGSEPRSDSMNKNLAIIGGVMGAIFVGLAYYMFNYKELTYTTIYGSQIPTGTKTYPEVATILLIIGIIGFVVMVVGLASKSEHQSINNRSGGLSQTQDPPNKCPNCKGAIKPDYILCPNCQFQLKTKCPQCGKFLEAKWTACPSCGFILPKKDIKPIQIMPAIQTQSTPKRIEAIGRCPRCDGIVYNGETSCSNCSWEVDQMNLLLL
jgi:hypothetical protein